MLRPIVVLLLATCVTVGTAVLGTVSGQAPDKLRQGFLSILKEGQSVMLKEVAGRFEISMFEDGPELLSHKVTEIGTDYVTVEDIGGLIETRLPVYSIKSIALLKMPQK